MSVRSEDVRFELQPARSTVFLDPGRSERYSVRLLPSNVIVPPAGVSVNLSLEDTSVATVSPATVLVNAQRYTSGEFTITGGSLPVGETNIDTRLNMSAVGVQNQQVRVQVGGLRLVFTGRSYRALESLSLGSGLYVGDPPYEQRRSYRYSYIGVQVADTNGRRQTRSESVRVTLSSGDERKVEVPEAFDLSSGSSSPEMIPWLYGGAETDDGTPVYLTASASCCQDARLPVQVVRPGVRFLRLDEARDLGSPRNGVELELYVPGESEIGDIRAYLHGHLHAEINVVEAQPSSIVTLSESGLDWVGSSLSEYPNLSV